MAKVFCVVNQKGGVGKTTTCTNLAAALSLKGKRVLLIDLDPQGNATTGSGVDKRSLEQSVYQLILGEASFDDVVVRSKEKGFYDVLPGIWQALRLSWSTWMKETIASAMRWSLS